MTQEEIRETFSYDETTGKLTRRKSGHGITSGTEAGCLCKDGRRTVQFSGKKYKAHRLIWYYLYGCWPKHEIDHINGDPSDNRVSNLREVSHRGNGQNRIEHRAGKLVGSYFHKRKKKWQSRAQVKGRKIHLGYFDTEQEASEAYFEFCKNIEGG